MPLVEPGELETFLILAEELHFGRTARRRQVTPQRVSQLIRALERRVGGALFERTSRRVALTDLGRKLHADLHPHYQGIRDALESAAASARGVSGTLRVGYINALWGHVFVEAAETLHMMQPGTQVIAQELLAGDALQPLRDGDVDVMCAGYPLDEPDVTIGPVLLQERAMLVVNADHPFAGRESVSPEDLAAVRLLSAPTMPAAWIRARCPDATPSGVPIPRGPVATSVHQALALIALGQGAFIFGDQCMSYHRHPRLATVPISDFPMIEWGLVHLDGARTPLLEAFAQVLAAVAHDHTTTSG
ncbi:LysR family transcriptional regulator [Actinomadura barringtoniae]|uniref:LysR family transcriptional regulator n=1 Tax=Actinomadura barringtoniae TaxID=1427535 RepID=A0A939T7Q1_9ACTN|nr:LysR family transcriptional regulator [Actinomadura barringtoniae]MBO2449512.1 LysR family transcriptional regulator [Actinomadura barringtoniae]